MRIKPFVRVITTTEKSGRILHHDQVTVVNGKLQLAYRIIKILKNQYKRGARLNDFTDELSHR